MLELYQDKSVEAYESMPGITMDKVEPGIFANFLPGTGQTAMQGLAKAGRAASMGAFGAVSGLLNPVVSPGTFPGTTVAKDRFFKWHDDVFNGAVDYWTPKPNEVGVAGEVAGSLLSMLPLIFANPGAAVAATQLGTAEDLARKYPDVSATKANLVGAVQGAGLGLGIWMPILGQTLAQRVLVGGAGFNVLQGAAMRGVSGAILDDTKAAEDFKVFDGKAITLDVLLGMAFGAGAHIIPSQRQQGAEAWKKIDTWAKNLKPSEIDALMVLREGQHINEDSLPGKPATGADITAHVDRMRQAINDLASDKQVDVENIKVPVEQPIVGRETLEISPIESKPSVDITAKTDTETTLPDTMGRIEPTMGEVPTTRDPQFTPDIARLAEAERQVADLQAEAERVRLEEGLPKQERQDIRPPNDITALDPVEQAKAVGRHIERALLQAGMDTKEAVANAAVWEAFAKSAHERYGVPPAELMAKWGVDVRRMDSADKLLGALEQRYNQDVNKSSGKQFSLEGETPEQVKAREDAAAAAVAKGEKPAPAGKKVTADQLDMFNTQNTLFQSSPTWYSELARQVDYLKMSAAPAKGWKDTIKGLASKGVIKPAEIEATGLNEWLDIQESKNTSTGKRPFDVTRPSTEDSGDLSKTAAGSTQGNSPVEIIKTPMRQFDASIADSGRTDTQLRADLSGAKTFSREGLGSLNIQTQRVVMNAVRLVLHDREVFDSVVRLIPVDVMDRLVGQKTSPEVLLHNPSMLLDRFTANNNANVPLSRLETIGSVMPASAFNPAKVFARALEIRRWANDGGTAEITGFFHENGSGNKITKEEVQQYLNSNGVKVEEVVLSDGHILSQRTPEEWIDEATRLEGQAQRHQARGDTAEAERLFALAEQASRNAEGLNPETGSTAGVTKFGQYQLPGGENYRELLLTLPPKIDKAVEARNDARMIELLDEEQRMSAELQRAQSRGNTAQVVELNREIRNNQTQQRMVQKASSVVDGQPVFNSSHFDTPNILAHIRFNERTDADGKRVLFIEEIQSDWAQKGKKEGFANTERYAVEFFNGDVAYYSTKAQADKVAAENDGRVTKASVPGIPSAPFVGKTEAWVALSLKRMIRYAAENGFDRVAWTNGEQQVSRYTSALRKQVDAIEWTKTKDGVQLVGYKNTGETKRLSSLESHANAAIRRNDMLGFDTPAEARAAILAHDDWIFRWGDMPMGDAEIIQRWVDSGSKGSRTKVVDTTEKESVLSDAIGKAMADKIKNDPAQSGVIEGADIKIDDTGMATFYDRIVPNVANDVLKKLGGGKVTTVDTTMGIGTVDGDMPARYPDRSKQPGFDITPAMLEKVMSGMPLFQGGTRGAVNFETGKTIIALFEKADKTTFQHETGHVFLEMTKDLASRADAPVAAMQDWATIADWLKIEGGTITREAHEQWARGWEKYLAEGVAPNEGLKAAFRRFRDWIIDVYKSLTNIDAPLNNQIRGVMARMLESQAKDPISKGGLEDPRLQQPEFRKALDDMGREAGWAEIGGSIIREHAGWEAEGEPNRGAVVGRSEWIPRAEWYGRMQASAANMPGIGGKTVRDAVRKALLGEKMTAGEKRAVTWMLNEHVDVMKRWDEVHGTDANPDGDPFEIANTQHDEGIEPTKANTLDMTLIDRAREVAPDAFEAIPTNYDDAQYMAAVREIVDANKPRAQETDQGGGQDAQGQGQAPETAQNGSVVPRAQAGGGDLPPPLTDAGETSGGSAGTNMAQNEARRFAAENPEIKVVVGTDDQGNTVHKSLNKILDDAAMETELAMRDVELFTVAAECLMGVA